MKKNLLLFSTLSILFTHIVNAQESEKLFDKNGEISFIKLSDKQSESLSSKTNKKKDIFQNLLQLNENSEFVSFNSHTDNSGFERERFQLYYKGIPVENSIYITHTKNNKLKALNGKFSRVENLDTTPTLSPEDAKNKALNHLLKNYPSLDSKSIDSSIELVILESNKNQNTTEYDLVYKLTINSFTPLVSGTLFINAKTGEYEKFETAIFHQGKYSHSSINVNKIYNLGKITNPHFTKKQQSYNSVTGTADTRLNGTVKINTTLLNGKYILLDSSRGGGISTLNLQRTADLNKIIEFTDDDNKWTKAEYDNVNKDNSALDVHWALGHVYDYFKTAHNRNSYDGNGSILKAYMHYRPDSRPIDNAYWNGNLKVMLYGEGNTLFNSMGALDVTAHEVGHGISFGTAKLNYERESGALNEGFSDIWGAVIENYVTKLTPSTSKKTWTIGEEIGYNGPLRSMSNPKLYNQPDTYGGNKWWPTDKVNCITPDVNNNDYCGVHSNSGVLNHWFYILSEEKSGTNDKNFAYNVTGIGIDKAAQIAYIAQTSYLTPDATFADARIAAIQAAKDKYGVGVETKAVADAFDAVGVTEIPKNTTYCSVKGNVTSGYIYGVGLRDKNATTYNLLNFASGNNNGYGDYTNKIIQLLKGGSYILTIQGFYNSNYNIAYPHGYRAWIDYNGDNNFSDDEIIGSVNSGNSLNKFDLPFTIPQTVKSGNIRMRVGMKYNATPTACETNSFYGEFEDYTISIPTIGASFTSSLDAVKSSLSIYPNPVVDNLYISGTLKGHTIYTIYNSLGQIIKSGTISSESINVSSLTKGVYNIVLKNDEISNSLKFIKK
ncbi:M4 family metallopeptidase [Empedobacter falsenii]|uniref:M4 family metallopeptidase n=1 Tax=Empedobacter falsenii TaxID=343874 RepID=UPI0025771334|nr:M4 family metallopeptidase [Empedobacter falsenii]MDM1062237.1 M4 family metallopeptidase [Empedobacter falsenii]